METHVKNDGIQHINLPQGEAPLPLGAYSHAVKAGGFVYLCGLGARSAESGVEEGVTLDADGVVVSYDIGVQTRSVLNNLVTVLKAADCTLRNVIDVQVFLRDMKDFPQFNTVYAEYFNFENPPARTTIEARPPGHNYIEIKAVAFKP